MKVAYLGPDGSYSHQMARQTFPQWEGMPCRDFEEVFAAVEQAKADACVIPIENAIEGSVGTNMDLLSKTPLFVIAERDLPIDNRVFTLKEHGEITRVLSHPQAYNQCRRNVSQMLPDATFVPVASTAQALCMLDSHTAAVAGAHEASNEYLVSAPVSDCLNNVTRFFVLSREQTPMGTPKKLSIVFEAENRPGGLVKVLNILAEYGLNMTTIESRPTRKQRGTYLFFVDLVGSLADPDTEQAIRKINLETLSFKLLGNY